MVYKPLSFPSQLGGQPLGLPPRRNALLFAKPSPSSHFRVRRATFRLPEQDTRRGVAVTRGMGIPLHAPDSEFWEEDLLFGQAAAGASKPRGRGARPTMRAPAPKRSYDGMLGGGPGRGWDASGSGRTSPSLNSRGRALAKLRHQLARDPRTWTVHEVCSWLDLEAGLPQLRSRFTHHRVSGAVLMKAPADPDPLLLELGVGSVGAREEVASQLLRLVQLNAGPSPASDWGTAEVAAWLVLEAGLPHLKARFVEARVGGRALLESLGDAERYEEGDRRALLNQLKARASSRVAAEGDAEWLHRQEWGLQSESSWLFGIPPPSLLVPFFVS